MSETSSPDDRDISGSINKPRRAEPLQPDKPGQGDETQSNATADANKAKEDLGDRKKQEDQAVENVRKGYD